MTSTTLFELLAPPTISDQHSSSEPLTSWSMFLESTTTLMSATSITKHGQGWNRLHDLRSLCDGNASACLATAVPVCGADCSTAPSPTASTIAFYRAVPASLRSIAVVFTAATASGMCRTLSLEIIDTTKSCSRLEPPAVSTCSIAKAS